MAYTKPQVIAQNAATGSYAAGCPANMRRFSKENINVCRSCEITQ